VRANWFNSPSTQARYNHVFELTSFSAIPRAEITVVFRLAASLDQRDARAREKILDALYERALDRNTKIGLMTCAPFLVRMFRKYGWREYLDPIEDPIVGKLHRMVLALHDLDYLAQCDSPLHRIAKERELAAVSHDWLSVMFNNYKAQYAPT